MRCFSTRACYCCLGEISNDDDDHDSTTRVTINQECGCVERFQLEHGPDYYIFTFIYINISIYTYIDTNIHLYSKDQKNTHMIACLACYHRKARNKASHLRITTRNPLQLLINSMKCNKLHAILRTPDTFYVALLCCAAKIASAQTLQAAQM